MRISKLFNKFMLAGMVLSLPLVSCTRAAKESKSTISFTIPQSMSAKKVGTLAFDTLVHVSINVTGSGITAPILLNWDSDKNGSGVTTTAPTSFSLDIPQGPDRLIQVLAVYRDSTSASGTMQFYYGELTKTLAAPFEDAPVTVTSVGQGATIISGRIQGRYLTSSTTGPSGRVDIVYVPPGGKAPMVVERSMMISGWFQFFGLIGAQLGYRMQDGTFLWGGPVDLSETTFPVSNQVMRAALPIHLRSDNYSGKVTTYQEDPSIAIYGFFGDPALVSAKAICKSTATLTRLLKIGTATPLTVTDNNSAEPSNLFDTTLGSINLRGGVALGGSSPCDTQTNITANLFGSDLAFNGSMLENGGDDSAGFRLPFQLQASNNGGSSAFSSTVVDANKISVSATLLPDVANVLDNFSVYKAINLGTNFNYHSSFAPCEDLLKMGYTLVGDTPVSGVNYTANLPLTDAEATGGAMFALCPTKAGVPIGPGFWLYASYLRGGMGGGGGVAAKVGFQNLTAFTVNQCGHIGVQLLTSTNGPASSPSAVAVNLSGAGTFYAETDFSCLGSPVTTLSIPANSNWAGVNFKTSATPDTDITLTAMDASAVLTSVPQVVRARASGSTTAMMFKTNAQAANVGTCLPVSVDTVETSGNIISYSGPLSVTVTGATIYTDPGCSTTGGTLNFASGVASFYVKATAAGWANLQATATIDTLNFTANYGINIFALGQPTKLAFSSPASNYLYINQCMPITVTAKDDTGAAAALPASQIINFSSGGMGTGNNYFSDANCMNSLANMQASMASGQSSITVYFKPPSSGGLSLNASISANNYWLSGWQNYSIGALWMHVIAGGFNGSWYDNSCGALTFQLMDNSTAGAGAVIPNLSGSPTSIMVNTNLSTSNGGLYLTSTCTDTVMSSNTAVIPTGASSGIIYMRSLLSSGTYMNVSPVYTGGYSSIYPNGNTLTSMSFAWCPPLDGGGSCPSSLALSGNNVGGGVALFPTSVLVGSTMDTTITLTNNSGVGMTLMTPTISGTQAPEYTFKGGTYPGIGGTCSSSLATASSCTVVVTFAPTATGGRYANLNFYYNSSSISLSLQGTGM